MKNLSELERKGFGVVHAQLGSACNCIQYIHVHVHSLCTCIFYTSERFRSSLVLRSSMLREKKQCGRPGY